VGEKFLVILPKFRLPRKFRYLLHAGNLRHGTDGFTSPPKEGVLRILFRPKNPTISANVSNLATLEGGSCTVLEAVFKVLCTPDDGCG